MQLADGKNVAQTIIKKAIKDFKLSIPQREEKLFWPNFKRNKVIGNMGIKCPKSVWIIDLLSI